MTSLTSFPGHLGSDYSNTTAIIVIANIYGGFNVIIVQYYYTVLFHLKT